jgi:hypothetical protein
VKLTHLSIVLQQDVDVYRSMPLMLDITRLRHLVPSAYRKPVFRAFYDPVSTHDDQDSNDGRTLPELIHQLGMTSEIQVSACHCILSTFSAFRLGIF